MHKFCCLIVAHLIDKVTKQQKSNKLATNKKQTIDDERTNQTKV